MRKRLLVLVAILLLVPMVLVGCGGNKGKVEESTGGNSSERDTFRVGLEAGYAPFNWTQLDDSNGGVKIDGNAEYAGGYDVEIAKRLAEGLGKN